jgi:PhzF family phenazine biosynthesis protein
MQKVASEMNLADTAFLYQQKDGFDLRWFTPSVEVQLCGHATLASAYFLWEEGYLKPSNQARFYTKSGLLKANNQGKWISLDFPIEIETPTIAPSNLIESLGVTPTYIGKNRFDYIVEVESEDIVRKVTPNFELLKTIPARGITITSRSASSEFDFVSRFFGPRSGVNEDPVTGSSHCYLGPFWKKRLNKNKLTAYQASSRGGIIRIRVGDNRIYLEGQAVLVFKGEMFC